MASVCLLPHFFTENFASTTTSTPGSHHVPRTDELHYWKTSGSTGNLNIYSGDARAVLIVCRGYVGEEWRRCAYFSAKE